MLTGGTGDLNLRPEVKEEESEESVLSRVRSLLVFSVENQGPKIDTRSGLKKADVMMERWKALFSKYDSEGSGTLTLRNIKSMVRKDLKIRDRLVSDIHITSLFNHIDEDGGGTVDFYEFLEFVNEPSTRGAVTEAQNLKAVCRGVRLCIMRNKIRVKDLEANFYSFDASGEVATGELGPNDMIRFFRKVLKLTKHECTDKALRIAFNAMDDDGSGKMSLEELMDFLKYCTDEHNEKEIPDRVHGLIGGMRGELPDRLPSRRPGMHFTFRTLGTGAPGSLRSTLPFCLNGRNTVSGGRLAQTQTNWIVRSSSDPGLPSLAFSAAGSNPLLSKTMSSGFFEAGAMSSTHAGSEPDDDVDSPKSATRATSPKSLSPKKRVWSGRLPGKTRGGYMLLEGAQALNQVEDRLFAAGIDVRGHYHKLGRFRPEYHTAGQH